MLKIIQWGTGVTGQHVARAVIRNPDFELVGCYVTSAAKNGRDVGDICGIGPVGVTATSDPEVIYAMPADVVLYQTLEEFGLDKPVEEICRILRSGKNVVSTAATALIYPKAAGAGVAEKIEAACQEGGTTFHANGIEPGWAGDVLPLVLSGMLGKVDAILIQEIMDYGTYPSPVAMYELMKFGSAPVEIPKMSLPPENSGAFGAPLLMVADALGATIDEVVMEFENAIAEEGFDIAAGRIEKGTVAGKRSTFTAMIGGKPRLAIEHVTRCGPHIRPDWPRGCGWYVTAKGSPSFKISAEIAMYGDDPNDEARLAAACHVIHAIEMVCAAEPGIKTLTDLPMIVGKGILADGGVLG